ncbi:hypothetical protein PSEUDO8BK_60404 [Pseudomonas sp. 8BK]|nr:hypothetical protein PSEUDO8BK_60404 [Pseudomonas sp. 8BK]
MFCPFAPCPLALNTTLFQNHVSPHFAAVSALPLLNDGNRPRSTRARYLQLAATAFQHPAYPRFVITRPAVT